jgi:trehalose 6-phosphate synthase/phosphatase
MDWIDALVAERRAAGRSFIALDYDGTLTPLVRRPELAPPSNELRALLRLLASRHEVLIISGREQGSLGAWLSREPVSLVAEHGLWFRRRGEGDWRSLYPAVDTSWKPAVRALLDEWVERAPGSFVEEKSAGLAWHYREADPERGAAGAAEIAARLASLPSAGVLFGAKVVEIRAHGFDKGRALAKVRELTGPFDFELVAGDDKTDEEMFAASRGWTIKIGGGPTRARERLPSSVEMLALLERLAAS